MKTLLKRIVPKGVLDRYRDLKLSLATRRNRVKSRAEVFEEVYRTNRWGGSPGEYYSGTGTGDESIASAYIAVVREIARREGFVGARFVDLGCGDFRIGSRLASLASTYVGVDIVQPLVERNRVDFGSDGVRFECLDIVEDELPQGQVCFIRQVLQHLSNAEIMAVLPKLDRYQWVFITEHHPSPGRTISPNIDIVHGGETRLLKGSGVFLSEVPFGIPVDRIDTVLELAGVEQDERGDPGIIRTMLYRPSG